LLELVSPGCEACRMMDATTLADPAVKQAMSKLDVVKLGIEHDTAWRLFEQLDLAATPAFVVIGPDGTIGTIQGLQDRDPFLAFLR
jgi:thiol:disulfide interchange protein